MAAVNENYRKLPGGYLFSEIARRVAAYEAEHPGRRLIRMGIGDVTLPLAPAVTGAMVRAAQEMGTAEGFHGYGPEQGYLFLRETIAREDYRSRGVDIAPDEIFISDGAKSDCGSIGDIFALDNVAAVCDPVYPVYAETSAMAGRAGRYRAAEGRWDGLVYLPCVAENGFLPEIPSRTADLIYLCFPNNPTGAAADRAHLRAWVDYANHTGAVLLYDGAYEAFITDPAIPHSIFEIEGARTCAIEFRSFSKTAGFTGTRCAYTVIPKELERDGASLRALWSRRQSARSNGVSYVVQRGAAAVYTPEGQEQVRKAVAYYLNNARVIREGLAGAGLTVYGGENAPYLWVRTPDGMDSWTFFDRLLRRANVVVTPGAGFGPSGEGYVRLTAFGRAEDAAEASELIRGAV